MAIHRYWVLGADYVDTDFRVLRDPSPTVVGPFDTEAEAALAWRELSGARSSFALTRYSILSEKFSAG